MEIAEREVPKDVVFSSFESEEALPDIMALVEKDLSEPYSIFTYRYFILGWPELTIMAREAADNKLLGVIVCKADRQNRRKRLRGYIAMLAVEKDHRKRGIGSYLAYAAIKKMKDMGCDDAVLETEYVNSAALSLYERLGFTRDKRLCRYYLNGGDAFRLKLWFTSPSWDDSPAAAPPLTSEAAGETPAVVDNLAEPSTTEAQKPAATSQPTHEPDTSSKVEQSKKGKKKKSG